MTESKSQISEKRKQNIFAPGAGQRDDSPRTALFEIRFRAHVIQVYAVPNEVQAHMGPLARLHPTETELVPDI